ncbi:hypothetical protein A4A49_41462 [Nicotiana attenuata]|uniref:Uncharacterized protein n=1 Tax=Nicotiana attenuata TaxID=49451 RepID=A0A314KPG9_NICAT|nr:hypothetical protein A4A49_41462 [Nicotiana attenuata]
MQENLGRMESNVEILKEDTRKEHDNIEQAIVPRDSDAIETVPIACASGTGSPMQIQINVPFKSPNQILHGIITHKELPVDIENALVDQQQQYKDKGDDESIAGNFKAVAREGDLSIRVSGKSGKKGKKQTQAKEPQPPTRILPKKAASTTR